MSTSSNSSAVSKACSLLGVQSGATEIELKRAWKKLAFEMHPDRGVGTNDQLANINAAYSLLKSEAVCANEQTETRSRPRSRSAPFRTESSQAWHSAKVRPMRPRPSVSVRFRSFTTEMQIECNALVADEAPGHGHVAVSVVRQGRKLTYFVPTELSEGTNCVALPTGDLVDPRKIKATTIRFSAEQGGGSLILPEAIRAADFPGATDVTIKFGVSQPK